MPGLPLTLQLSLYYGNIGVQNKGFGQKNSFNSHELFKIHSPKILEQNPLCLFFSAKSTLTKSTWSIFLGKIHFDKIHFGPSKSTFTKSTLQNPLSPSPNSHKIHFAKSTLTLLISQNPLCQNPLIVDVCESPAGYVGTVRGAPELFEDKK